MANISEELLEKLRSIRNTQQQIQFELGGLALAEEDINVKRAELIAGIKETVTELQEAMKEVKAEHGDGSVNLETGEFTLQGETPATEVVE